MDSFVHVARGYSKECIPKIQIEVRKNCICHVNIDTEFNLQYIAAT